MFFRSGRRFKTNGAETDFIFQYFMEIVVLFVFGQESNFKNILPGLKPARWFRHQIKIINQIAEGCQKSGGIEGRTFYKIPDRAEAIRFAIEKAEKDEIVVICGKGHEKTMCFGRTEYLWSDQREVRRALKERSVAESK